VETLFAIHRGPPNSLEETPVVGVEGCEPRLSLSTSPPTFETVLSCRVPLATSW
jgi:hypothetical protein